MFCFHILLWSTRHSSSWGVMDDLTQSSALCCSWPRLSCMCQMCLCVLVVALAIWKMWGRGGFLFFCACVYEWGYHTKRERLCVCVCAHVWGGGKTGRHVCCTAWLTEVIYMTLHLTLTETHGVVTHWVWTLMGFYRINVKCNRSITLILSALVLRYKVAS